MADIGTLEQQDFDLTEIEVDNEEDEEELGKIDTKDIIVYARDWTIDTIYQQIDNGNIDLNPAFQRRNAWTDDKRSKLIESIMIGYPIPEIVLAEDMKHKRTFIVIDGKQRLLTLAGFMNHEKYKYWDTPKLKGLKLLNQLNGKTFEDFCQEKNLKTEFGNSSLRCSVITNYRTEDGNDSVLYDLFYRLNSGSVKLSTQELRQALYRGHFSNWLIEVTSSKTQIHHALSLSDADKRMRDAEMVLRLLAFCFRANKYKGNLKSFLDESMQDFNQQWEKQEEKIKSKYEDILAAIDKLKIAFEDYKCIGRKYQRGKFESRSNKVLLEVEIFYFMQISAEEVESKHSEFIEAFKQMCTDDNDFRNSIESSTKNIYNYKVRYSKFGSLMQTMFSKDFENPFV